MEEQRKKGFSGWWILLALVVGLAAGYMGAVLKQTPYREGVVTRKIAPEPETPPQAPSKDTAQQEAQPAAAAAKTDPYKGLGRDELCSRLDKDVADFFEYVSDKSYFKHIAGESSALERFKAALERLSARPPIPGGEGIDSAIIIDNIYYLFRTLKREDIRIIKDFMANEGEGLELDLHLLHRWLMLDDCKKDPALRPSFDLLYQMAGFFLNTIGGRAYLARRPAPVKTLATYYCILILHEANNRGRNSYGIDILPHIAPVKEEIRSVKDLALGDEYLRQLELIERHYTARK